ncbi:MAG: acetyl-CoA synthetase [Natronomonas sp.]|jgi:acetyl-CoA synthetase
MQPDNRLDTYHFYERDWDSWEQLRSSFEWEIPDEFKMAEYVCDRWAADNARVAVFAEAVDGTEDVVTFWQLRRDANRLANALADRGVGRGDRIMVHGGQRPETLVSFVAAWKLGAAVVPVSTLLSGESLSYRLDDSGASVLIAGGSAIEAVRAIEDADSLLDVVVVTGEASL